MNFFGALLDLKEENLKLEKGRQNPYACFKKIQPYMTSCDFLDFRTVKNKNLFLDSKLTD